MNKKKIVLISTYPDIQAYGLRILSAILKIQGFSTSLIFLNMPFGSLYSKEILMQVAELSRDSLYVGVSLMTNFYEKAKQVTLFIKEYSNAPVVWGGIHTAIRPYECLKYADMICLGEAEDIIGPLSEGLMSSNGIEHINNIWLNKNGGIIKNKVLPLVSDINRLPLPDYDYSNHYLIDSNRLVSMDSGLIEQYMGYEYSTMGTRGCFYNCTFCANNFFDKNFEEIKTMKLRSRKMEDIVNELVWIKEHLPHVRIFKFVDDLFMALPKESIEEFCKLYKKSALGLPLNITGIHPLVLREDKLKLLIDAGLMYVRMGIQTGSKRVRAMYGRRETDAVILAGANILHKYRRNLKSINYDFIVDNPWELSEDVKDSLMLLARVPKPYVLNLFSLTLYPGTELYNKASGEGIIKNEGLQVYGKHYHDNLCNSYYNGMFKVISAYTLPVRFVEFLINNNTVFLAKILYYILFRGVSIVDGSKRIIYLLQEGLSDIMRFNLVRINKFIFIRSKVVR